MGGMLTTRTAAHKARTIAAMIPIFRPFAGQEEIDAVAEVIRSGWWGLGPRTGDFERRFAEYVGAAHCVGVNSGTAALLLGLVSLNVEGGEVVSPSLTFVSTNHAIVQAGARPVFADVDPETLTVDPADVERLITPATRAIVAVDYAGHPAELDALSAIARANGIPLLEDAAHACGATYRGRRVGSIADVTCFSFHAIKNLAMGEGGGITVAGEEQNSRLRWLRWLGLTQDSWQRAGAAGHAWDYDLAEFGFKANMSDLSAAIGLVQLGRLESTNARRREIVTAYSAAFADLGWLETLIERPHVRSSWHLYAVRVPERDRFVAHLTARGVGTSAHYRPNHLYEAYRPYARPLPVTEAVWPRLVTIPLFPGLTDAEVDQVIEAVRSFEP
jgi:perosamine synthetase